VKGTLRCFVRALGRRGADRGTVRAAKDCSGKPPCFHTETEDTLRTLPATQTNLRGTRHSPGFHLFLPPLLSLLRMASRHMFSRKRWRTTRFTTRLPASASRAASGSKSNSRLFAWPDLLFETSSDASNGLPLTSLSSSNYAIRIPLMLTALFDPLLRSTQLSPRNSKKLLGRAPLYPVKGKNAEPTEDVFLLRRIVVSNLSPVSRETLAVSSRARRFRFCPRRVRPLARGHDDTKGERLAEIDVRQKYERGFCNSNGECGHTLWTSGPLFCVPGSPPRNESNHTLRKVLFVIPPSHVARTSSHWQPFFAETPLSRRTVESKLP